MERWMIIYLLPLEVWMDIFVFPWIDREKFGEIVHKIGNFKFAENAQFYLHEWGKRKLGQLHSEEDGFYKRVFHKPPYGLVRLDLPQTALPENIKSFDRIIIQHFDWQTMDFLDKTRPLLTDLRIGVCSISPDCLENVRKILAILTPMLDGFQSLYCGDLSAFPAMKEQLFRGNEKLPKLKLLEIGLVRNTVSEVEQQENATFITNWLSQPDTDGPKLFKFSYNYRFYEQILKAIREQFHAAKTQSIFAVNFEPDPYSGEENQITEFHLENGIGEVMHGIWRDVGFEFQIIRHPAGWNTKEAQEWIEGIDKRRYQPNILIDNPTIGRIEAAQVDARVDEKQQDGQQQPCSSRDT